MGIKAKALFGIGGLVLTGIAAIVGLRKKEDQRYQKVQGIIQNVDKKKPEPEKEEVKEEEPTKTIEEITSDVDEALSDMDIQGEDEQTQVTDEEELSEEEICKRYAEEAARKREERLANGEWLKDVQKAAEAKSFSKLETLLNEKYNPYPYHPAPSDPFGQGYHEGVIDENVYKAAQKYYGRLWCYSGD